MYQTLSDAEVEIYNGCSYFLFQAQFNQCKPRNNWFHCALELSIHNAHAFHMITHTDPAWWNTECSLLHCEGFHNLAVSCNLFGLFKCIFKVFFKKLMQFQWLHFLLFSTVCCQMSPQMACLRRGIVTLVAFVRLFSTVGFQMFYEITSIRGGIFALVAFVWLFSTVC